jgi:hypothetical protein
MKQSNDVVIHESMRQWSNKGGGGQQKVPKVSNELLKNRIETHYVTWSFVGLRIINFPVFHLWFLHFIMKMYDMLILSKNNSKIYWWGNCCVFLN